MWLAVSSLVMINAQLSHSSATHAVPTFVRPEQTKAGTTHPHLLNQGISSVIKPVLWLLRTSKRILSPDLKAFTAVLNDTALPTD